jgi:hypothetical protein
MVYLARSSSSSCPFLETVCYLVALYANYGQSRDAMFLCLSTFSTHTQNEGSQLKNVYWFTCSWYLFIYIRDFMAANGIFGSCSLARLQHIDLQHAGCRYVTCCYRPDTKRWSPACMGLGRKLASFTPRRLEVPGKDSKLHIQINQPTRCISLYALLPVV